MAVLKGIKEKVHLPLYDSLFVRPRRQLRETETSSILKFFVNVQGKTRLETNMQSASLLPHWNTFEARALRVVISDLPPQFPAEVEQCLNDASGQTVSPIVPQHDLALAAGLTPRVFSQARERVEAFNAARAEAELNGPELDECLGLLRAYCDPQKMGPILQLHRNLRLLRADLATVIRRNKAKVQKPDALNQFADELEAMSEAADDLRLFKQLDEGGACLDAIEQEMAFAGRARAIDFAELRSLLAAVERDGFTAPQRPSLSHGQRGTMPERIPANLPDQVLRCLMQRLGDERKIPLADQVFGDSLRLFSRLIFHSVTTFFVGEKVMIQMPTWFFPAGGGPYSGNGRAINHGFPAPEATFRFAEPVFIDAQQNFRVEIEIPETDVLGELQRIYGPFFIWVTLDGYMRRDVQ
jgi:hypothetical protein